MIPNQWNSEQDLRANATVTWCYKRL